MGCFLVCLACLVRDERMSDTLPVAGPSKVVLCMIRSHAARAVARPAPLFVFLVAKRRRKRRACLFLQICHGRKNGPPGGHASRIWDAANTPVSPPLHPLCPPLCSPSRFPNISPVPCRRGRVVRMTYRALANASPFRLAVWRGWLPLWVAS